MWIHKQVIFALFVEENVCFNKICCRQNTFFFSHVAHVINCSWGVEVEDASILTSREYLMYALLHPHLSIHLRHYITIEFVICFTEA